MTVMGGTLQASSQLDVGTTFTACLPVAPSGDNTPPRPASIDTQQRAAGPDTHPAKTLLYIEDNSSNIELMKRLLRRRRGWKLITAGHAELGMHLARTNAPDLVLLDLHLPDMNGLDVLRLLQADPVGRCPPIVVVSADANPHQIGRLLAAGADRYLTKPINIDEMLNVLDTFIGLT